MSINETATGNDSVAITGTASGGDRTVGVLGDGESVGVKGVGKTWHGVEGLSHSTIGGFGVFGANTAGGTGVVGVSKNWVGVLGTSESTSGGPGVMGENSKGTGVFGKSISWVGVYGESESSSGVLGKSKNWIGVEGVTDGQHGIGVKGKHNANGTGVYGETQKGVAVFGDSKEWVGVLGETHGQHGIGVMGKHYEGGSAVYGESPSGIGIHGKGGRLAGYFEGHVEVTGDIRLTNADCAEDFDIGAASAVEPGTVMVLGEEGSLVPNQTAYDKRVAGVVSGGGSYKPGIVLDKQPSAGLRQPLALLGKVYCKVDAQYGAVEVGDLLTTSATQGHAMKANDPLKAFGTVIGKALKPLKEGQGLIPILIALQ